MPGLSRTGHGQRLAQLPAHAQQRDLRNLPRPPHLGGPGTGGGSAGRGLHHLPQGPATGDPRSRRARARQPALQRLPQPARSRIRRAPHARQRLSRLPGLPRPFQCRGGRQRIAASAAIPSGGRQARAQLYRLPPGHRPCPGRRPDRDGTPGVGQPAGDPVLPRGRRQRLAAAGSPGLPAPAPGPELPAVPPRGGDPHGHPAGRWRPAARPGHAGIVRAWRG